MQPFGCALPGVSRLRTLQPLIDGDGACSLVYDLERAVVIEVPEELKNYVAPALESGNLDEELVGWLTSSDLLTSQDGWGWSGCEPDAARLDAAAAAPWDDGEETHGWIDQQEAGAAIEAMERVWKRALGSPRIKLHLDWAGNFPAESWLEIVVADARRRAAAAGQEVAFELALAPEQVTVEVARRLAAHPVHVRLRCGECDPLARVGTSQENRPWLLAEPAVKLLLEQEARIRPADASPLPPASPPLFLLPLLPAPPAPAPALLTVQCMLDGPARLIELWRWAKAIGVRKLDAIRLEESGGARRADCGWPAARIREYRQDLYAIFEETCAELEAGGSPVEFQPLIRIVRRLRRREAAATLAGRGGELAVRGDGRPFARVESLDPRLLPEQLWMRLEGPATPAAPGSRCQSCWARQVCSHSAYVASALGKEDPRDPSRERCAAWSAEVEMAVRLCHRLAQIDAIQVMRFFGDAPALHAQWPQRSFFEGMGSKPS
ncbi:MAG TPA: hypothetical protein VJA16_24605 [Thermoanaerobaculia bacterium]